MPFIRIWIHVIWATKNREPLLTDEIRQQVFQHIKGNAIQKGIFIDCLNGSYDHLHCLLSLGPEQTIAKVVQLLKGESTFWINKNKLTEATFEWQDEYFAISVSEGMLPKVRAYIQNQEQCHQNQPFEKEREQFLERYRFK